MKILTDTLARFSKRVVIAAGLPPWITVADLTNDGAELIDLATFPGLDLTDGEKFATRIVTTADYDYSGMNCIDGCNSVFRDRVTAGFVPEPSRCRWPPSALG